jgi:hypothetical protein
MWRGTTITRIARLDGCQAFVVRKGAAQTCLWFCFFVDVTSCRRPFGRRCDLFVYLLHSALMSCHSDPFWVAFQFVPDSFSFHRRLIRSACHRFCFINYEHIGRPATDPDSDATETDPLVMTSRTCRSRGRSGPTCRSGGRCGGRKAARLTPRTERQVLD